MARTGRFVHENLGSKVAEYLREEILWLGRLKKGQRIQENDIANELNLSRAPVREALKELEHQGLVVFMPRRGTFVSDFDHDDLMEIYDIRYMLESRVFETIIQHRRMAAEDFRRLRKIVDEMVALSKSSDPVERKIMDFAEHDIMFHRYIWEKSDQRWSLKILSNLYYQLRLAMMQDMIMEQDIENSAAMHYDIIDCLENGDLEGAKLMLVRHIATLWRELPQNNEIGDPPMEEHRRGSLEEISDPDQQ
ncbi:MAG: GntR family transcriptional regulator [Thermovirgaceae bacterium]|nr:GntR family transcriptional regulator [Thermovirgaceae bacterium]